MRIAAIALALVALPLATPSFAASSATSNQRHLEACNALADHHDVTGYARSGFVQKCFERQAAKMDRSTARGANG